MTSQCDVELLTSKRRSDIQAVSVRIPLEMLKAIDKVVAERQGLNRHAWILEALQEKVEGKQMSNLHPLDIYPLKKRMSSMIIFKCFFIPCRFIMFYNPLI